MANNRTGPDYLDSQQAAVKKRNAERMREFDLEKRKREAQKQRKKKK